VQALAPAEELDAAVNAMPGHLLQGGPAALAATRRLISDVAHRPVDDAPARDTARRIAQARASDEGREGIASFIEKRRPPVAPGGLRRKGIRARGSSFRAVRKSFRLNGLPEHQAKRLGRGQAAPAAVDFGSNETTCSVATPRGRWQFAPSRASFGPACVPHGTSCRFR